MTAKVISFLLGSLVLAFPSCSNLPYVTSSRRYVTTLPTSRVIGLVRLLLAVGRVTANLCGWVTGSPGQYLSRVTGSHLGDPVPMLVKIYPSYMKSRSPTRMTGTDSWPVARK